MGRPTLYTEELADKICERIATSDLGLAVIAEEFDLHRDTIFKWIYRHPAFFDKYARAREAQQERMAEEILDIADDNSRDTKTILKNGTEIQVEDTEWVNRSKLRVDTRKWLMSKLAPKKYGDKVQQQITGADGGPMVFTVERIGKK